MTNFKVPLQVNLYVLCGYVQISKYIMIWSNGYEFTIMQERPFKKKKTKTIMIIEVDHRDLVSLLSFILRLRRLSNGITQ